MSLFQQDFLGLITTNVIINFIIHKTNLQKCFIIIIRILNEAIINNSFVCRMNGFVGMK